MRIKKLSGETACAIVIFLAAAYLSLQGLSDNYFWDDEASTAAFAKNILTTGRGGTDNRSVITHRVAIDSNLESIDPPLMHWIAALSFKLLGYGTWAGRIPFVLIGLASLVVFWFLLARDFPGAVSLRCCAFSLTALSYSFLLNIRQCRYYAPCIFCSVLSYYAYRRFVDTWRMRYCAVLGATIVVFYYSNYLLCAAFCVALAVVHVVFYFRKTPAAGWLMLAGAAVVVSVAVLPHLLGTRAWERPDIRTGQSTLMTRPLLLYWNLRELDSVGYLPGLAVLPLVFFIVYYRKKTAVPPRIYEWFWLTGSMVVALSFLSAQPVIWQGFSGGLADVRYLVIMLPFCSVIVALFVYFVYRGFGTIPAVIALGILLCSTLGSINVAGGPVRWLLPSYIHEAHVDYTTPYEAAIEYLDKNAAQDDMVYTLPGYTALPFMFYLGDKVKIGSQLTRDLDFPVEKIRDLGIPAYIDEYFPDWIVSFGMNEKRQDILNFFSRGPYRYVHDAKLDVYWKDMTRPELSWHSFGPVKRFHPVADVIHVFRREEKHETGSVQEHNAG